MLFTKRQESELITAIKGRGEIPLKFAYLGEGAKNWDKIAHHRTDSGGINSVEGKLLADKATSFISAFGKTPKINVIDIGCGNGLPTFPIMEELQKKNIPFRYIPIDISNELLDLAEQSVQKEFNVEVKKYQLDFELGNFSDITYELKSDGSANLLCFLGSTLGNHSDRSRVLTNFRDSMSSEDFLIIGVELTNFTKINKILTYYKDDAAKDFVCFIPEQIGINRGDAEFNAEWNEKDSQIEIRLLLKKDIAITIGSEKFPLENNESILVGRSLKFTEWAVAKQLSDVSFRNELLTTNPERSYLLSMVQPTRYSV